MKYSPGVSGFRSARLVTGKWLSAKGRAGSWKWFWCLLAAAWVPGAANAQKSIVRQGVAWGAYQNFLKLNDRWTVVNELHTRFYFQPSWALHQRLWRGHLHRKFGASGWEGSLGFCAFLQSPNDPASTDRTEVPELRPHLEAAYRQSHGRLSVDHRYRAELRYFHNTRNVLQNGEPRTELVRGYTFRNVRVRYQIMFTYSLWKGSGGQELRARLGDELHVNFGDRIVRNSFDQNRVLMLLGFSFSPTMDLEAGYVHWYQQRDSGVDYFERDMVRVTVNHRINWPKPREMRNEG
jgi:Protein of unknown function (DUF2490)